MNNIPLVSIVITTYNRPEFLREAIQSALEQDFPHKIEILVINDADANEETDKTVASFKKENIKYIKHPKNMGIATSRNTGIKEACGEFIFFLDDDDLMPLNSLSLLWSVAENHLNDKEFGGATGAVQCFVINNRQRVFTNKEIPFSPKMKYVTGGGRGIMKRNALIETGRYNTSLKTSEDTDMAFRFFRKYYIATTPNVVYLLRRHRYSSLHNKPSNSKDYLEVIQKYSQDLETYPPQLYGAVTRTLGINLCLEGNVELGRHYLIQSIYRTPFRIKTYVAFIASFFGKDFLKKLQNINTGLKNE